MIFWSDPLGFWGRVGRGAFFLPSLAYEGIFTVRRWAYKNGVLETVRVPPPVFCVGNLTVGGSGKTPGVIWLVQELLRQGHRPAVVSRGYGRKSQDPVIVVPAGAVLPSAEDIGDEPRLLLRRLGVPLAVASDRALAAERVWRECRPDCLVMDDGFQHHRLHRDLNFLCMDARLAFQVFMEKHPTPLLPAGPWREKPVVQGNLLFLTRAERLEKGPFEDLKKRLEKDGFHPVAVTGRLSFSLASGEPLAVDELRGGRVLALSGVGDPVSFEQSLTRLGLEVAPARFQDHHWFSLSEIERVLAQAHREGRRLIVTEKDRERLPDDFPGIVTHLNWDVDQEALWKPVIASVFS